MIIFGLKSTYIIHFFYHQKSHLVLLTGSKPLTSRIDPEAFDKKKSNFTVFLTVAVIINFPKQDNQLTIRIFQVKNMIRHSHAKFHRHGWSILDVK